MELGRNHHVGGELVDPIHQRHNIGDLRLAIRSGEPRPVDERHHRNFTQTVVDRIDLLPLTQRRGEHTRSQRRGILFDRIRQIQGGIGRVRVNPMLRRHRHNSGTGFELDDHLLRRLTRNLRCHRIKWVVPHDHKRQTMHKRIGVDELRVLVQIVGLPNVPQLRLGGPLVVKPEAVNVKAFLERVHHQPRPVHHHAPKTLPHVPGDLRSQEAERLGAGVVLIQLGQQSLL